MAELVSIDYELGQHGWSSFRLTAGTASIVIGKFGYCTDALGDLVRAALIVATSGSRSQVSFDGEPHEWRLVLEKDYSPDGLSSHRFHLRVLSFRYLAMPLTPEAEGIMLFEADVMADAFAKAVEVATEKIWAEHGPEGYNQAWGGMATFPLRALRALSAALETQEPKPAT